MSSYEMRMALESAGTASLSPQHRGVFRVLNFLALDQVSSWPTTCSSSSSCATLRPTWPSTLTTLLPVWSDWRPCSVSPVTAHRFRVCGSQHPSNVINSVCAETFNTLDTDRDGQIYLNFFQVQYEHIVMSIQSLLMFVTIFSYSSTFLLSPSGSLWPCLPNERRSSRLGTCRFSSAFIFTPTVLLRSAHRRRPLNRTSLQRWMPVPKVHLSPAEFGRSILVVQTLEPKPQRAQVN